MSLLPLLRYVASRNFICVMLCVISRRMADLGMTIVTVVHQPRYGIFVLFDEVLLLGKSGRTVFQGPSTAALPYFNSLGFQLPPNENPADFCLDVISGSIPCQGRPDFRPEVRHTCTHIHNDLVTHSPTH